MSNPMPSGRPDTPALLGNSHAMVALRAEIAAAARTQAKVMILGETGAGKEVVARHIHSQGARRTRQFLAVNCSGIPETLLESELFGHVRGSFTGAVRDKLGLVRQADGGTLFLDELGEMSLRMQAVLLRFTETGEIQPVGADGPVGRTNVRLVTATNRDLRQRIAEGAFREDLYYRLNVIQINVPPLRERGEDVLLLLEHYFQYTASLHGLRTPTLNADATQIVIAYDWPGNVRELRNVAERLVLQDRSRPLTPDDLPRELMPRNTGERPSVAVAPSPERGHRPAPPDSSASSVASALLARMRAGEDFWTVVARPFKAREITRADLAALIDLGLTETRGSYRALLREFNLPDSDYKRFHAFLYTQQCNHAVGPYREYGGRRQATRRTSAMPADAPDRTFSYT